MPSCGPKFSFLFCFRKIRQRHTQRERFTQLNIGILLAKFDWLISEGSRDNKNGRGHVLLPISFGLSSYYMIWITVVENRLLQLVFARCAALQLVLFSCYDGCCN